MADISRKPIVSLLQSAFGRGSTENSPNLPRRIHRPDLPRLHPSERVFEASHDFAHESLSDRGPLLKLNSWACQLQGHAGAELSLDDIKCSEADVVIIDYSRDGSALRAFTAADVNAMKIRRSGPPKQLIAYISIGEAEAARFYWRKEWAKRDVKQPAAPGWLYRPNEGGWTGNWRVKFWDPDWQKLIIGEAHSFLNQVIDAGFDGVFMDIIEAAEYWEDSARGHDRNSGASKEMITFVSRIAHHARVTRGKPNFLLIPNGDFLLERADYRAVISGLMREDILYAQAGQADETPPRVVERVQEGNDSVAEIAKRLNWAAADNLPVLAIEYLMDRETDRAKIPAASAKLTHLAPNVLPYFSVRNLDRLCPEYASAAIA